MIGADRFERSLSARRGATAAVRGSCRPRPVTSSCGSRSCDRGSFFPSVLERRRRIDQALYAVVIEAYVHGVSTRKVDDLVQALGIDAGISKSEVSRICAEMDNELEAFRTRALVCTGVPLRVLRRHLREGPGGRPGGVTGRGGRHWGRPSTGNREVLGLASATPRTGSSGPSS